MPFFALFDGADLGGMDVELLQQLGVVLVHHVILADQHLIGAGLADVTDGEAAADTVGELLDDLAVLADLADGDAFVLHLGDDVAAQAQLGALFRQKL